MFYADQDASGQRNLTAIALQAAKEAAGVIMDIYGRPFATQHKADGSPVTEADEAAEAVILKHLNQTGIPVLGEESVAAGIVPVLGERYFVVDPLDGTKEFIKRNGEFTVNIALVEHGFPIMGVVLAPASGDVFVGDADGAYYRAGNAEPGNEWHKIGTSAAKPLRIVASRSHGHEALAQLCHKMAVSEDVSVGSSLKFCLVARGDAQLYPRFTPTSEWDTAAGQAVLEAAGGAVVTLDGQRMQYGKHASSFLNSYFLAAADETLAQEAAQEMTNILQKSASHATQT